jgi:hypothetical protein
MRSPSLIICIFVVFITSIHSQLPYGKLNTVSSDITYSTPPPSSELADKRGLYQKAFKTSDGKIIYQFSKTPLCYKDLQGKWMPVEIKATTNQHGFIADKQNNPVSLGYDGTVEIADKQGSLFSISTVEIFGETIVDEPIKNNQIHSSLITGKNQYFNFLTEQVLQRSEFRHNGLKLDYVFQTPVNTNGGTIIQQLHCHPDWKLTKHSKIPNALGIQNAKGEEMGILYPVICKDAGGKISLGEYSFQKNDKGYLVKMQVDNTWFNSAERTFPIIVDPLIVGPTALWGAVYMPSCLMPSFNVDSLQVTIPGQVMITGVFCSGSYYADPFAGAIMSEGHMFFSTSCANGPDLTVAPPAGNSAGTGYCANVDFRNPIGCCLGQSCSDRQIYVRMHLGRTAGGAGCTTSYLYYDAFTLYPFSVYIEGHTLESTGTQWTVSPTTICSDQCSLSIKPFVRYGVPPYVITHPWAAGPTNLGAPVNSCAITAFNVGVPVTRPGCPTYCDTTSNIVIPTPTVTDACGNVVASWPARIVNLNPTPQFNIVADSVMVCSGEPAQYTFNICPSGTTVNWTTTGFSGTNSIDTLFTNPGPGYTQTVYAATATLNGCAAIPDTFTFYAAPNPIAAESHPAVGFIQEPINFTDVSNYFSGNGNSWLWTFGDGANAPDSNATHTYANSGTYNVCLYITSSFGCMDTICDTIKIIPNKLILPNVLTANNDGLNDVLYFQYLPYYGVSALSVYNRWGEIVYQSGDYKNDWAPVNLVDGTYFYIIKIPGQDPYSSTLNIFNKD